MPAGNGPHAPDPHPSGRGGSLVCGEKVYCRQLFGPTLDDRSGAVRQALHAAELGFRHPITGEPLEFEMPMPADMAKLLAKLRVRSNGREFNDLPRGLRPVVQSAANLRPGSRQPLVRPHRGNPESNRWRIPDIRDRSCRENADSLETRTRVSAARRSSTAAI